MHKRLVMLAHAVRRDILVVVVRSCGDCWCCFGCYDGSAKRSESLEPQLLAEEQAVLSVIVSGRCCHHPRSVCQGASLLAVPEVERVLHLDLVVVVTT